MPQKNPYYDDSYASAGASLAEALFGNPEKASELEYKRATQRLTEEKTRREKITNDELTGGLEAALTAAGNTPESYNAALPALYASMARSELDPADFQTPMFAARSMVNSPEQYGRGALLTAGKEPGLDFAMSNNRQDQLIELDNASRAKNGRGRMPATMNEKSREAMAEDAMAVLSAQLGDDFSGDMIPEEAMFRARSAGESAYQDSRSHSDAVQAMIDALGVDGASVGEIDKTPGSNWNPLNWGGGEDVLLDSSGSPINFDFQSAPKSEEMMPAPARQDQQEDPAIEGTLMHARDAIAGGADENAVRDRLMKMGIDPGRL